MSNVLAEHGVIASIKERRWKNENSCSVSHSRRIVPAWLRFPTDARLLVMTTAKFRERHKLLTELHRRLAMAQVTNSLTTKVNDAPSVGDSQDMPVIILGDNWAWIKVLYWEGKPYFTVFDSFTRYETDEAGIDHLASILAVMWMDRQKERQ